ncbi:MAG: PocR ligand-binding domain-containing protein [Candidatus Omnitrophica bacterium]|nr:PocR ligand-binding domain-containing protein [Candidatus Omnitrophota bacterium]
MDLFDIIEKDRWQHMQEGFREVLGVCIQTVDLEARLFPGVNKPCSFCLDMITRVHEGLRKQHEECVLELVNNIKEDRTSSHVICPFGLYLYGIPIELQEMGILAFVIVGPVSLKTKKGLEEYKKIAKDSKIPLDYLTERLADLKKFTFSSIESAVELLGEVAHYIVQLKYDAKKLKERLDIPKTMDNLIKGLYSSVYFEEFLNTFLDVSLNTTKGNSASIMLLEEDKDELKVRYTRGLDTEFTKDATVKIGEGISGLVAKERKPLLIDDSVDDPQIKKYLKRPQIKSSIVYPIEIKERVLGVININSLNAEEKFTSETVDLMANLTHLAKIALQQFSQTP